jgi:peroxiredoxin
MKKLIAVFALMVALAIHIKAQHVLKVGDTLDSLRLKNIDGSYYSLNEQNKNGFILVFMTPSCDHCLAYVNRVIELNKLYGSKGFPVVAIGPYGDNEKDYPFDAMPAMKKLAQDRAFTFPYLADEKFKYTWLFDLRQTPKAVVLKKVNNGFLVKYIGNIDNQPEEKATPTRKYVEEEVDKLL